MTITDSWHKIQQKLGLQEWVQFGEEENAIRKAYHVENERKGLEVFWSEIFLHVYQGSKPVCSKQGRLHILCTQSMWGLICRTKGLESLGLLGLQAIPPADCESNSADCN